MQPAGFGRRGMASERSGRLTRSGASVLDDDVPAAPRRIDDAVIANMVAQDKTLPQWAKVTYSRNLKATAIFLGIFALLFLFYLPHLQRDFVHADHFKPTTQVSVTSAKCHTVMLVASFCSFTMRPATGDYPAVWKTRMLVGLSTVEGPIRAVQSSRDSSVMSVNVATHELLNTRIVTFGVLSALLWGFIVMGVRRLASGRYIGGTEWERQFGMLGNS